MVESAQKNHESSPQIQFQAKLTDILYTPINVENIGNFADAALEKLVTLNEAVVDVYTRDFDESDQYTGSQLEDQAYTAYGLENLNDILNRIVTVRDTIARITSEVHEQLIQSQTVITPPDSREVALTASGNGTYEAPKLLNRIVTLAYILERDFDITQDDVEYVVGSTTNTMMRKEPYVRVSIPDLNRVVYVCDEEGNASYIFDTEVLEQLGVTINHLDELTKNQRNAFIRTTPTVGRRIIQSPEWRTRVANTLSTPFSETEISEDTINERVYSEFREQRPRPDFQTFVSEVKEMYETASQPAGVKDWYHSIYKQHPGWPSNPDKTYKGGGWTGWAMLVSKEVAELLSFEKFANEVQKAYEKAGSQKGVSVWYKETYRSQKGWPGNPYGTYKEKGWEGWPKLIGKEVKEQITFEDFTLEVREEYKKMGSPADTYNWYSSINKIHPGWPASPGHTYKEKGWRSWPELVGKEVVKFLPFDDFLNEVRHEYKKDNEPSAVQVWYKTIYKQHPGWPSTPNDTYQSDGWVNYATMIDKKTYDFSTFTEFETAVREVYEEAGRPGNVIKWYTTEQKNHPGWQTKPNQKYQNQGWMGWPQLVGKK